MTSSGLSGAVIGTFRTLPARVLGWLMVAGAAVLATLTIVDVAGGRDEGLLFPAALILGIATVAWVLFLRPHVRLREDGVELANVVTNTTVPFAAVSEITHQWAFELHDTEGRRHSSWAIPVKRERVRRTNLDDFAETTRKRGSGTATAQGVADVSQRALQRWRLDGGQLRTGGRADAGAAVARQEVAWPAVVALSLALALGLLAVLG